MMKTIWLFCTVIDNWGDVGVSWRLARELRCRLGARVYVFLDDWGALAKIAPNFADEENIIIKQWHEGKWADLDNTELPNVAIEMFACRLPETVVHQIKANQAVWLNWEYLSAEDWARQTHAMLSVQADGFPKYFWQMGFVAESGGLIREQHFNPPKHRLLDFSGSLNVLMFGYVSEIWAETLRAWQMLNWQVNVDLAGWQIAASLRENGWLPEHALQERGAEYVSGSLKLRCVDFVPQHDFDDLLSAYDCVFVRGEDSFVRAQFSGKPFFWHIYPQDECVHLDKLDAFWHLVFGENTAIWQRAHHMLSHELNGGVKLSEHERLAQWQILHQHAQSWQQSAWHWQQHLLNQKDTVSRLADWLAKM